MNKNRLMKRNDIEALCESCVEMFTSEKKLKGILRVNQRLVRGTTMLIAEMKSKLRHVCEASYMLN